MSRTSKEVTTIVSRENLVMRGKPLCLRFLVKRNIEKNTCPLGNSLLAFLREIYMDYQILDSENYQLRNPENWKKCYNSPVRMKA